MNSTNDTNHSANLYTIYTGSIPSQGNVNYGFNLSHPLAPPPKYEDVVSGHYPCTNDTSICPQSTLADVNSNQHINRSEINYFQSLQSEPHSQQGRPLKHHHSMPPPVFPLTQQQEAGQTGVILIAPVNKVMGKNSKLLSFFIISIAAGFVIFLILKWV